MGLFDSFGKLPLCPLTMNHALCRGDMKASFHTKIRGQYTDVALTGSSQENYEKVQSGNHEATLSHELVGSAAAFAGMKAFEAKQRKDGKPVSHAMAKELLAAAVGFEVDRLAETKGEDAFDKFKAHEHAKKEAEEMYKAHYEDAGKEEWHP